MTQDGQFDSQFGGRFDDRSTAEANPFAAAEQVSATLGALTDALFDGRASRHPVASLDPRRGSPAPHPAAEALFGLPLAPNGPVHAAVDRLGTVVTAGTARPGTGAPVAERTVAALLARYGGGPVRGTTVDHGTSASSAVLFQLPVTGEIADPKLRPPFAPALAALAGGQQTRLPVELATGAGTEVRLVVPPGFHPLTSPGGPAGVSSRSVPPLDGTLDRTDHRAAAAAVDGLSGHLAEVAEELFSATDGGPRRDFAVITAALADVFHAAGVVYAGVCALEADGRTTEATLVVSLARHPLPITALATELATVRRHAEVWTVLLPAGPAAVLVEGRTVPVPGALAADGQRRWVVTSVVEAFVPLPDGVSVLCVQLSTAQPEDWDLYTEAFAELLKSVQFGWDGTPGVPAPVLVPVSAPAPVPTSAPLDYNPFAALVEEPDAPAAEEDQALPDFNPFAALAEEPVGDKPVGDTPVEDKPAEDKPAEEPAGDPALRGTPVRVPPPDFNPFAPETLPPLPGDTPDDAPAVASTAGDPFGADEPSDPFGTTLAPQRPPVPPAPSVPPRIPAQTDGPGYAPAEGKNGEDGTNGEDEEPTGDPALRGTPVRVPPPDFNPFAPETLPPLPGDTPDGAPTETPATPPAPEARPFG